MTCIVELASKYKNMFFKLTVTVHLMPRTSIDRDVRLTTRKPGPASTSVGQHLPLPVIEGPIGAYEANNHAREVF